MGIISPQVPTIGGLNATEDLDVRNALVALLALVNGGLDASNIAANAVTTPAVADGTITANKLATALQDLLGVTGSATRRGKSIIATSETRNNAAYGTLTTPDQVSGIVLPTDGLIAVSYRALFSKDAGNAFGAIFLNNNELLVNGQGAPQGDGSPATNFAVAGAVNVGLVTADTYGLRAMANTGTSTSLATTGTVLGTFVSGGGAGQGLPPGGGICWIEAAAGTYDISVRYKTSSGTITVSNRALRVWTVGFG